MIINMPTITKTRRIVGVILSLIIFLCDIIIFFMFFAARLNSLIDYTKVKACPDSQARNFFLRAKTIAPIIGIMLAIQAAFNFALLMFLLLTLLKPKYKDSLSKRVFWTICSLSGCISCAVFLGYFIKAFALTETVYKCTEDQKLQIFYNEITTLMVISCVVICLHLCLIIFAMPRNNPVQTSSLLSEDHKAGINKMERYGRGSLDPKNEHENATSLHDQATQFQLLEPRVKKSRIFDRKILAGSKRQESQSNENKSKSRVQMMSQEGVEIFLEPNEITIHSDMERDLSRRPALRETSRKGWFEKAQQFLVGIFR